MELNFHTKNTLQNIILQCNLFEERNKRNKRNKVNQMKNSKKVEKFHGSKENKLLILWLFYYSN